MLDGVVKGHGEGEVSTHVVWLPILPDDDAAAAARASARLAAPGASHYWDPDRALGEALGKALELPPRDPGRPHGVAWDVYLLYPRRARLGEAPSFWMHQLEDVPRTRAPRLSPSALRSKLDELVAR